jgi:hypothetical protein
MPVLDAQERCLPNFGQRGEFLLRQASGAASFFDSSRECGWNQHVVDLFNLAECGGVVCPNRHAKGTNAPQLRTDLGMDIRPLVVIESPFAGDLARNIHYADCMMMDSLRRGESPFLGHLLYPRVWDDTDPEQRDAGIAAHCAVIAKADYIVFGMDLGDPTRGMLEAEKFARRLSRSVPITRRYLGLDWQHRIRPRPTPRFNVFPYGLPIGLLASR